MEMKVKKLKENHDKFLQHSFFLFFSHDTNFTSWSDLLKQVSSKRFFIKRDRISLSKAYFEEDYIV